MEKNNYKLLYIEDEDDIRNEYLDYFSIFFDSIYESCDGEDGWEKYIKYKPDIIIADISMPKLNGLDLVKKLRKKLPDGTIENIYGGEYKLIV